LIPFLRKHLHILTNVVLAVCLGRYAFDQAHQAVAARQFDFVEVAFAVHNVVMLTFILIRKQHQALDSNLFRQGVALVAFFSGIFLLMPTPPFPCSYCSRRLLHSSLSSWESWHSFISAAVSAS
jgi:hypothetical protein